MKKLFSVLLWALFVTSACKKSASYSAAGTLAGPDLTLCPCCGGIFLQIDGDNAAYRIDSLPGMSRQHLYQLSFPQRIRFNHTLSRDCGQIKWLDVNSFRLD